MTDEAERMEADEPGYSWDIFLAHAGPDATAAKNLYLNLNPDARVFLDAVCLQLGDDFDLVLTKAQQSSLISVVLVSPNTGRAYYEREEIAAAIQMAREDPHTHRVVPVYLNKKQIPSREIPYGLRLKHSLDLPDSGDLTEAKQKLLDTLRAMKGCEAKKEQVVKEQREAIARITGDGDKKEKLSGITEVTRFVRPLLVTFLILFVLMLALLIICLLVPTFAEVRGLLATVLGSLCALLLASILWLAARSIGFAEQIARGHINGG